MYSVYALVDPRDLLVRYVGMSKNVILRFAEHLSSSQGQPEKYAWVLGLMAEEILPEMHILENMESITEARKRELFWIRHFLDIDMPILNRDGVEEFRPLTMAKRIETHRKGKGETVSPLIQLPPRIPQFLTVDEAVQRFNLPQGTIVQWLSEGNVKGFRFKGRGGAWRVAEDDLQNYVGKLEDKK